MSEFVGGLGVQSSNPPTSSIEKIALVFSALLILCLLVFVLFLFMENIAPDKVEGEHMIVVTAAGQELEEGTTIEVDLYEYGLRDVLSREYLNCKIEVLFDGIAIPIRLDGNFNSENELIMMFNLEKTIPLDEQTIYGLKYECDTV